MLTQLASGGGFGSLRSCLTGAHDVCTASGAEPMDADGYESADEGVRGIGGTPPEKKTIAQLKDWLTEQGHEEVVWKLTQEKAKKPAYVAAANQVLGA